jgi:hypothetical protein
MVFGEFWAQLGGHVRSGVSFFYPTLVRQNKGFVPKGESIVLFGTDLPGKTP